jgi:hypothetical protein
LDASVHEINAEMKSPRWRARALLALLTLLAAPALSNPHLLPVLLHAQSPALRGQVVDPEGQAVAGITVSLHRVTDGGGAEVGRAVSDQEGRFEIDLSSGGEGVYFAATRFEGALYMGEPFRTLAEVSEDYRIVIGVGGVAGGLAQQPPIGSTDQRPGWAGLLLFAIIGIAAVALPLRRARRGPLAVRTLLAEIAELDEGHTSLAAEAKKAAEGEYLAARTELFSRLRALSG